jgi:hypothetical protein
MKVVEHRSLHEGGWDRLSGGHGQEQEVICSLLHPGRMSSAVIGGELSGCHSFANHGKRKSARTFSHGTAPLAQVLPRLLSELSTPSQLRWSSAECAWCHQPPRGRVSWRSPPCFGGPWCQRGPQNQRGSWGLGRLQNWAAPPAQAST